MLEWKHLTAKISFIRFSGFHGKKRMTQENASPYLTFFNLKRSGQAHIGPIELFVLCFKQHFPVNGSAFVACSMLEPWKHSSDEGFLGFFCFMILCFGLNESVPFNCFPLSNHCTDCWLGEPEYLRDVSLFLFRILAHRCEILSFSFVDDKFRFLSVVVLSGGKWQVL